MSSEQGSDVEWVWLARIRKPQGRKGEVLAEILTDFPEKFGERKRLWLLSAPGQIGQTGQSAQAAQSSQPARETELRSHWLHKGAHDGSRASNVVLHFAGVESINDAEALRNLIVAIPRTERVPLGEDEVYVGDLIGCSLVDIAASPARVVGTIEDVDREAGPVALLVVNGEAAGEEILIPFAKAYLRRIDLDGKRVEMALPEGLVQVQLSAR